MFKDWMDEEDWYIFEWPSNDYNGYAHAKFRADAKRSALNYIQMQNTLDEIRELPETWERIYEY